MQMTETASQDRPQWPQIKVAPSLHRELKKKAMETKITLTALVNAALFNFIHDEALKKEPK
jgi:hypothetical protein